MEALQAIKEINASGADENIKTVLCMVAEEWDRFLELKQQCAGSGLMAACYKDFGVKFMGMYSIGSLEDLVCKAEANDLFA